MDGCTRTGVDVEETLARGLDAISLLDHDDAAVRIEALYALERWGRDRDGDRSSIMDAWCSVLRRPVEGSDDVSSGGTEASAEDHRAPSSTRDEFDVRRLAQRLLALHLLDPRDDAAHPSTGGFDHWAAAALDLSGATLVDADLSLCRLPEATFANARFVGDATFTDTAFTGNVDMTGVRFEGRAMFGGASFAGGACFDRSAFMRQGTFTYAEFAGTSFVAARFGHDVWFNDARFAARADFSDAAFTRAARFHRVAFDDDATFDGVAFGGEARFDRARIAARATFDGAGFDDRVGFDDTEFVGDSTGVELDGATVVVVPARSGHVPPRGWTVLADPDDASRGRFVRLP